MQVLKKVLFLFLPVFFIGAGEKKESSDSSPQGLWESKIGIIEMKQEGNNFSATLVEDSKACPFKKGKVVFQGSMMEDTLTGEFLLCQQGEKCEATVKAFVVLILGKNGSVLTGASHAKASTNCEIIGASSKGGFTLYRVAAKKKAVSRETPVKIGTGTEYDPLKHGDPKIKAEQHLREGFNYLQEGFAERARNEFLIAIEKNPARAEAYNGVGVTFYVRKFYKEALKWYKKALEINPEFGDAYYNMACIYSLEGKPELALRYLRISILNRYTALEEMKKDPDLTSLKDNLGFKKLIEEAGALNTQSKSTTRQSK